MAKQRDRVLDALKLFAIFLVLWGHCIQHLLSSNPSEEPLYRIIYSFHMPLFMALVGFFSGSLLKLDFRAMLLKKGRQLILPALTFGFIIFILCLLEYDLATGLWEWYSSLWFLKSAFICCVIYYLCFRYIKSALLAVIVSLVISQLISPFKVDLMYPCFLFGLFINYRLDYIRKRCGTIAIGSAILFITMLLFWDSGFWAVPTKGDVVKSLPQLSVAMEYIYKVGYRIVIGLTGTLFFIALFEYLSIKLNIPGKAKSLSHLGEETLGIYLLQTLVLEILLRRYLSFDAIDSWLFNIVVAPVLSLILLVICHYIIVLIKRSRLLSFLCLGQERSSGHNHRVS